MTNDDKIKVLVVDDSSLMRRLISVMIQEDPEIVVTDTAANGYFAFQKILRNPPDVILLDIEMPQMSGLEFLEKWKQFNIGIPVIVLSGLAHDHPELTIKSIEYGAADFVLKPSGTISLDIEKIKDEVIAKIKFYAKKGQLVDKQKVISKRDAILDAIKTYSSLPEIKEKKLEPKQELKYEKVRLPTKEELEAKIMEMGKVEVIAIGISTGGPNALREIIPVFPKNLPVPILIVQHMPPGFTKSLAASLDSISSLHVKEASHLEVIRPGVVYIAPGDRHLLVTKVGEEYRIELDDGPPFMSYKPSAEYLFNSVADNYGGHSIGVIMTGMGRDGARALKRIRLKGGYTIAQDEKTCVVFGMPKMAIQEGSVDEVLPLGEIPKRIIYILKKTNDWTPK